MCVAVCHIAVREHNEGQKDESSNRDNRVHNSWNRQLVVLDEWSLCKK
jgi:hypothetical protein